MTLLTIVHCTLGTRTYYRVSLLRDLNIHDDRYFCNAYFNLIKSLYLYLGEKIKLNSIFSTK